MERCDRIVLDVNVSCAYLWKKCLQLFSIHTLSECDATPYPYGKGNITVLNNLFVRDYLCLVNVLCEGSIKHANNLEAGKPFCIALYDKLRYNTTIESLFAKKNIYKVMVLPPTTANLFQQVLRAHQ